MSPDMRYWLLQHITNGYYFVKCGNLNCWQVCICAISLSSIQKSYLAIISLHIFSRFGPYFIEPVIAGLDPKTYKPFICNLDLIGCPMFTDDFVVGGTCTEQLYGMCESVWVPDLVSVKWRISSLGSMLLLVLVLELVLVLVSVLVQGLVLMLKALVNNVFTLNCLSCMSLHAISVFDKVLKLSPEKKAPQKHLAAKKWK